ncbi:MAG: B12-binding domain-containing radical SAM protein [Elusimicrobiota bacterium]
MGKSKSPVSETEVAAGSSCLAELDAFVGRFDFDAGAVLVNLPQVPFDILDAQVARNRGYFAYPPSSLLYLGACLRELDVKHSIVDLNYAVLRAVQEGHPDLRALCREKLREAAAQYEKPLLCVSFMFEATYPAFEFVCKFLRSEYPGLCIAAGGVNATADPDILLDRGLVDVVFCNEGEQVLDGFYRFVRGQTREIPVNIVFRDEAGKVQRTPLFSGGPVEIDIKPEYDLIPVHDYHRAGSLSSLSRMNGLDIPFGTILAKRGCRAFCAFCGVRNFNGKGVRLRGAKEVVDEMTLLHEKYGIDHFDWLDDDLLNDKKETLALFHEISERLPGITWAANNGLIATAVDRDLYEAMRKSGCIGFKVGLESGNDEMIKRIHKPSSVKQFLNFAKLAQDFPDIFVSINFILGLPEERFEQMRDSLLVAVRSRLNWHNFYMYQHLKNTEFYIAYGGLGDDYINKEHGKENSGPTLGGLKAIGKDSLHLYINPVRGGAFNNLGKDKDLPTGYEIFDIDPKLVPPRTWVREIWFTFITIANFLTNPCIKGHDEVRLKGMIRWLDVLGMAYPQDPMMAGLRYFLMEKSAAYPKAQLEEARSKAKALIDQSDYWQLRDRQFGFSSFLDRAAPELPAKLKYIADLQEGDISVEPIVP